MTPDSLMHELVSALIQMNEALRAAGLAPVQSLGIDRKAFDYLNGNEAYPSQDSLRAHIMGTPLVIAY